MFLRRHIRAGGWAAATWLSVLLLSAPALPGLLVHFVEGPEHQCACSLSPDHRCACPKCSREAHEALLKMMYEEGRDLLSDHDCSDESPAFHLLSLPRVTLLAPLVVPAALVAERECPGEPGALSTRPLDAPPHPPPIVS